MNTSSGIEMRVVSRMEETNQSSWETIRNKNNLLMDPSYLRAVEESCVIECEYRYFEFYESGQLICSMFGYVLINDAALFYGGILKKLISAIRKIIPGLLKAKTLEIGSPVGLGLTVSISNQIKRKHLSCIVDLLKEYSRQNRIKVVLFRDFNKEKISLESILSEAGFKCVLNLATSVIKIAWGSFEEYLSCLKKKDRYKARQRIRKKEALGIKTVFANDNEVLTKARDYVELYRNVLDRSEDYSREFIGEQYHIAMFNNLKGCNYWLQYFNGDELVAFVHSIVYKDHITYQYVGMDYEVSREAMLYFSSYYDQIKFAIENGIKSVEAGLTAYRVKSEMGFSVYPQRMYLWHKNPLLRPIIGLIFKATKHKIEDCHYAFKDNKYQYLWDGKEMCAF